MKIAFFDGYCNLCNRLVDWLVRVDKSKKLKFASLQGETAKQLFGPSPEPLDVDTVIYWRDGFKYERSTAILLILSDLGAWWRLVSLLLLIPRFIRDFGYRSIATNRYRIFGRSKSCRLATSEEQGRILP